jgi:redox-sensitive bicupin YhaK (pirin superfamily)
MKIYESILADVEGFNVTQAFPNNEIRFLNPFILLHHGKNTHPGGQEQKQLGVPPHPHRGFVPVTIVLKGAIHHRDSLGNSSVIHEGGVQWTESASGLLHSERPSKEIAENGGELEIIQLWVNLPSEHKMGTPAYYAWEKSEIPEIVKEDAKVKIISGQFEDIKGVANSKYYIDLLLVELNGKSTLNLNNELDSYLYIIEGNLNLNNEIVNEKHLVVLGNIDQVQIESENCKFLVMSGKDNGEFVAAAGPFVMNTVGDTKRAFIDYSQSKFGTLIEDF